MEDSRHEPVFTPEPPESSDVNSSATNTIEENPDQKALREFGSDIKKSTNKFWESLTPEGKKTWLWLTSIIAGVSLVGAGVAIGRSQAEDGPAGTPTSIENSDTSNQAAADEESPREEPVEAEPQSEMLEAFPAEYTQHTEAIWGYVHEMVESGDTVEAWRGAITTLIPGTDIELRLTNPLQARVSDPSGEHDVLLLWAAPIVELDGSVSGFAHIKSGYENNGEISSIENLMHKLSHWVIEDIPHSGQEIGTILAIEGGRVVQFDYYEWCTRGQEEGRSLRNQRMKPLAFAEISTLSNTRRGVVESVNYFNSNVVFKDGYAIMERQSEGHSC